jgi:hypothetical protein
MEKPARLNELLRYLVQSITTPKRGGMMLTLKGSSKKIAHRKVAPVRSSGPTGQAKIAEFLIFFFDFR